MGRPWFTVFFNLYLDFLRSHYYVNITESSSVVNRLTPRPRILDNTAEMGIIKARQHFGFPRQASLDLLSHEF